MLDDEHTGVRIITLPARLGQAYAAWVPDHDVIVVTADSVEEQIIAILRLVSHLLELSANRDRMPTRASE